MRHFGAIVAAALLISPATAATKQRFSQIGMTCFKSGENTSGMNKICFYNCLGSTVAINISSVELCPLTIEH